MPNYPDIYLSMERERGRVLRTRKDFVKYSLIFCDLVLLLNEATTAAVRDNELDTYLFSWDEGRKRGAISLGYGTLLRHSDTPNCRYSPTESNGGMILFFATQDIEARDELTIDYGASFVRPTQSSTEYMVPPTKA